MDFDDIEIDALRRRRGEKWRTYPPDVLPVWVADMDFPVAEPIRDLVRGMLECSDFGYPINPTSRALPSVFAERMRTQHGWEVDPQQVEVITDVVQGLYIGIEAFSEPGDALITPTPIYPPFLQALSDLGREAVWKRFEPVAGRYRIDFDQLRRELSPRTRMLLLCNPHNPTGRALERAELEALAEIAQERDLVVVSDEIHADLVLGDSRHIPFAALSPEAQARTITLTSATKAFNIAGVRCALVHIGHPDLQRRVEQRAPRKLRGGLGLLGLEATRVAWQECQPWLERVRAQLVAHRDFVADQVRERWPQIAHIPPEATYLAWLDCRALELEPSPGRFFFKRGRVALSDGAAFGPEGVGFARLNFATSRPILTEALERMDKALQSRSSARG